MDLDECRELRDSLFSQIRTSDSIIKGQDQVIKLNETILFLTRRIIEEKDVMIKLQDTQIRVCQKEIKRLKFQRTVYPVIAFVAGSAAIYYLKK